MTHTKTKTKTKCLKDPSHAIFSKSREFKDIRYDAYRDKDRDKDKDKDKYIGLSKVCGNMLPHTQKWTFLTF